MVTTIPLIFYLIFVYSSMLKLKISDLYGLYPYKNTDGLSLIWFSIQITKLASPLVFNFLTMLRNFDNTVFA